MTHDEAIRAIRAEMSGHHPSTAQYKFWQGVLIGFGCRDNFNMELTRDILRRKEGVIV